MGWTCDQPLWGWGGKTAGWMPRVRDGHWQPSEKTNQTTGTEKAEEEILCRRGSQCSAKVVVRYPEGLMDWKWIRSDWRRFYTLEKQRPAADVEEQRALIPNTQKQEHSSHPQGLQTNMGGTAASGSWLDVEPHWDGEVRKAGESPPGTKEETLLTHVCRCCFQRLGQTAAQSETFFSSF